MLEKANGFYEKFVILTLGHTGMRVSEFIQLRKNWFDRYEGIIKIPGKDTKLPKEENKKGELKTWSPKTNKGARTIRIPDKKTVKKIDQFFEDHNSVTEKWKDRSSIYYLVTRISKRANTEKIAYPHALRSYFANRLINKGLQNSRDLMSIMGWSSLNVAQVYLESKSVNTKEVIDKIRNEGNF